MAYMSQEHKKEIIKLVDKNLAEAGVKKGDLKITFRVRHHSTIIATIMKSKFDFIQNYCDKTGRNITDGHIQVNVYHLENQFSGEELKIMKAIKDGLNLNNYDNSDAMTDYFDVGHYIDIQVGKWDKPFEHIA